MTPAEEWHCSQCLLPFYVGSIIYEADMCDGSMARLHLVCLRPFLSGADKLESRKFMLSTLRIN